MIQKILIFSLLSIISVASASKVDDNMCQQKGEYFIFAGGECIEYAISEGDKEGSLNIVVHGTWNEGANTLGRYEPFAQTLALSTDITTIAVALPGYSGSSTNQFKALGNKQVKHLAASKAYLQFMTELIQALKNRYEAKIINYIGHSAGAMIGTTLTGLHPNLINNLISVGGRYDIHEVSQDKSLISAVDVMKGIDKNIQFLLIYGSNDTISKPKITQTFYEQAVKEGLNVRMIEVKNGIHLDLDMSDTSIEAITELLDY